MGVSCYSSEVNGQLPVPAEESHLDHAHALLFLRYTSGSLKEFVTSTKREDVHMRLKYLWAFQVKQEVIL